MKVTQTTRTHRASPLRAVRSSGATTESEAPRAARSVDDVATFLGIAPAELTESVRAGLQRLLEEVEALRQQVSIREKRIAYLERLADEDPLMPILNRRAVVRELTRMMAYCERYGTASSVLFIDVNGMKQINDVHGHATGDAALTHIANVLINNVRATDAVGRLGGDEFAVLLANADQAQAVAKGNELARLVAAEPIGHDGVDLTVRIAFGAFCFDGGGDAQTALEAADRAMYEQKRQTPVDPPEASAREEAR